MIKIMLDNSPDVIDQKSERFNHNFWQLRTPLTRHRITRRPYGLDNGCFSSFNKPAWLKQLNDAEENRPVFVCLPDVVGNARRTLELFDLFFHETIGLPRALVLQDGINDVTIPWEHLDAVFVGGSDCFKISDEAMAAVKTAKLLGLWVHVGRVNTPSRVKYWLDLADSIDGSGISRYDHMLAEVVKIITQGEDQISLNLA